MSREVVLRIVSGAILAPFALAISWADNAIFVAVVAAGAVILAGEWVRMSDREGPDLAFGLSVISVAGAVILASADRPLLGLGWCVGGAMVTALEAHRRALALRAGAGVLYIGVPGVLIVAIRLMGDPAGSVALTFLFVTVWGADIGAYLAGRLIGRGRLPQAISAQKTWSGLIGGLCLGTLAGMFVAGGVMTGQPFIVLVAAGAMVAIAALAGDLLESAIKRRFGVKDAGTLIPGHGGLFDRLDSLLIAAPVFAGLIWLITPGGLSL